jgi:hypothetical protein
MVTVAVTTASEDQVASVDVAARTTSAHASVHLDVLAYNAVVRITLPPSRRVQYLPPSVARELLSGRLSILDLLSPDGIARIQAGTGA